MAKATRKRVLSLLMALVLTFSLLPTMAFAASDTSAQQITGKYATYDTTGAVQLATADSGTYTTTDGVTLSKTIEGTNTENVFKVTLGVTTSEEVKNYSQATGANVVLVFDVSTSMDFVRGFQGDIQPGQPGWSRSNTRWTALKSAASSFIDKLLPAGNTANRVAIVVYGGNNDYQKLHTSDSAVLLDWTTSAATAKASYSNYDVVCQSYSNASGVTHSTSLRKHLFNDTSTDYGATNCQAGFRAADAMLTDLKTSNSAAYTANSNNVVFMSDGETNRYYGTDYGTTVVPTGGVSYPKWNNTYMSIIGAQAQATLLKTNHSGIKLYSVGFQTSGETASAVLQPSHNTAVDEYFDATNASALTIVFGTIVSQIKVSSEAWMVTDPMSSVMDKNSVTLLRSASCISYDASAGTVNWNLKKDTTYQTTKQGSKTYYTYTCAYTVKLNNQNPSLAQPDSSAQTNAATQLVYALHTKNGVQDTTGTLDTQVRTAYFNVPMVKSLYGNLTFTKVAHETGKKALNGAEFTLTDPASKVTYSATSSNKGGKDGVVTFSNIPSGHTYTLTEKTAAAGYNAASAHTYEVTVAWGSVSMKDTTDGGKNVSASGLKIENKLAQTYQSVQVTKNWIAPGIQRKPIRVTLTVNGVAQPGLSAVLNSGNNWAATISNVPVWDLDTGEKLVYSVAEEYTNGNPVTGFTTTVGGDNSVTAANTIGFIITNTVSDFDTPVSVSVTKHWNDDGLNGSGKSATIHLWKQSDDDAQPIPAGSAVTLTGSEATPWSYTFEDLDRYNDNGQTYTYTVTEDLVDGYGSGVITGNMTDGFTVTNTIAQQNTTITATKIWVDYNNVYNTRPAAGVTMNLYQDTTLIAQATATAATDWQAVFTETNQVSGHENDGIPTYDFINGTAKKIVYTLGEEAVEGYDLTSGNVTVVDNAATLTNTLTETENATIAVTKEWVDVSESARPESGVIVNLMNGTTLVDSETLTSDGNWTGSFTAPLYDKSTGAAISYTVTEDAVPGYATQSIKGSVETGFTVTNVQNVTETTSVNVQKAWVDGGNTDGRTAVTIQLTRLNASGEFEDVDGKTIELTDGNWANSFTDLPKYEAVYSTTANEDGSYDVTDYAEITYGVREDTQVSGYDAGYVTGDMTHGFIVTNTLTQVKISVDAVKVWRDAGRLASERPNITINVMNGSNVAASYEMPYTETGHTFENLDKYDAARNVISYTVTEGTVSGYTSVVTGNMTGGFTITNTITNTYAAYSAIKNWVDNTNADGTRPDSISLNLIRTGSDGSSGTVKTVTVAKDSDANTQLAKFVNPDCEDGLWPAFSDDGTVKYTYSVSEDAVTNYNTAISSFSVTNTLQPGQADTTSVSFEKVWVDPVGTTHPDATFILKANGTEVARHTLPNGDTTYTFTEDASGNTLPKYDASGVKIPYTVEEEATVDSYTSDKSENGNIFINTINQATTSVSVEKVWNGSNPSSAPKAPVIVTLMVTHDVNSAPVTEAVKNGDGSNKTLILNQSDGWVGSFDDLDQYDLTTGQEIAYSVVETAVADYTGTVTADKDENGNVIKNSWVITNTYDDYAYQVIGHYATMTNGVVGSYTDSQLVNVTLGQVKGSSVSVDTDKNGIPTNTVWSTFDSHSDYVYSSGDTSVTIASKYDAEDADSINTINLYFVRVDNTAIAVTFEHHYFNVSGGVQTEQPNLSRTQNENVAWGSPITVADHAYAVSGYTLDSAAAAAQDKAAVEGRENFILNYYYTGTSYNPPSGGGGDDDDDTPTPVVIPNNPTPLSPTPGTTTDIPKGNVPQTDVPETDIPDGETPLAATPAKTGDNLVLWILAAGVSGIGLVWVSLLGKKRRDEDGSQN